MIRTNRISVTERFKPLHKEGEALLKGDSHAHQDQTSVLPGKHNERVQIGRMLERLGGSIGKRAYLVGRVSFDLHVYITTRSELVLSSLSPLWCGVPFVQVSSLSTSSRHSAYVLPSPPSNLSSDHIHLTLHPSLIFPPSFSPDNRWRLPRRVCP